MKTPSSETAGGRKAAYKRGLALPPPSPGAPPGFPVTDANHWEKARQAVGRVKDPGRRAALARLLRKTAPRFGKSVKGTWAGASMSSSLEAIELAQMMCPHCGYKSDDADFRVTSSSTGDANDPGKQGVLRTPANPGLRSAAGFSPGSAGINVRTGPGGAGLSGNGRAVEMAARMPVRSASDVVVSRGEGGVATLRHRAGGHQIGTVRREGRGYRASLEGRGDLDVRTHERTAVQDLIGGWNSTAMSMFRRPPGPALQPPPQQTPLMAKYGVPAIRALATPSNGGSDGPRMTDSDGDSDGDLGPKGKAIKAKLKRRGFPEERAHNFAKRAQNMAARKAA